MTTRNYLVLAAALFLIAIILVVQFLRMQPRIPDAPPTMAPTLTATQTQHPATHAPTRTISPTPSPTFTLTPAPTMLPTRTPTAELTRTALAEPEGMSTPGRSTLPTTGALVSQTFGRWLALGIFMVIAGVLLFLIARAASRNNPTW